MMKSHLRTGWRHFWKQIFRVLQNPIFCIFTLIGNIILFFSAVAFYLLENETNPHIHSFFDALWWAIITMTTVGYGDIIPLTVAGKLVAILLIFTGSVLFLSFIALLASAFIELEFNQLESEVFELKTQIKNLSGQMDRMR